MKGNEAEETSLFKSFTLLTTSFTLSLFVHNKVLRRSLACIAPHSETLPRL